MSRARWTGPSAPFVGYGENLHGINDKFASDENIVPGLFTYPPGLAIRKYSYSCQGG